MADAKRDNNRIPTLLAVSSNDGITPVALWADPTTHRLLVDINEALGDLSDVTITSAAAGDIIYRNAGNTAWINLAAGSNGEVLTLASGVPSWATAGAGDVTAASAFSTDNVLIRSDGTGKGVQSTGISIADTTNDITGAGNFGGTGATLSGLTASEIVITDASKNLASASVATYPSLTELTYVKGVTSDIQTQLNAKAATLSGTINEIAYFDSSSTIASLAVATYPSLTELSYVKGVTSAIQTQLGTKAPTASPTFTGTFTLPTGLTGVIRADSGVVSVDSDVTDIVSAASTTLAGKVELDTTAEIDTGTDSTRAMPVDQFVASKRNVRWLVFNLVEATTDCAVATNIGGDFVSPIAGTILQSDTTPFYLYATNSTAGTTGTMVVDVNINGTSIMTTNKLDFDTTEKTTTTAATPPDLTTTSLAVGDIITIDVDAVHTTAAAGLTVYIAIRES